jgi:hypothetical protein
VQLELVVGVEKLKTDPEPNVQAFCAVAISFSSSEVFEDWYFTFDEERFVHKVSCKGKLALAHLGSAMISVA